jgi:hypothetical protein
MFPLAAVVVEERDFFKFHSILAGMGICFF